MAGFLAGLLAGAAIAGLAGGWVLNRRIKRIARFFSFAAHEINTPITAVNMTILNLLSGVFGPVPAEQTQWIELMREQIGRLNGMVGELRDLIHMELHRDVHFHLEDVPALELVDSARRALAFGCSSASIPLEVDADAQTGVVRCDPDRAPRTLASMLFHARKFRASGPLKVTARPEGGKAVFTVEYEAPKLTAEEAAMSLDLYFPAKAREDQRMSATGLGLGILRAVARLQGGDLSFTAAGGKGVLTLELPRAVRNSGETRAG